MTPAQWKRLALDFAARAATAGRVPGPEARAVLGAMLFRLSEGANFKTLVEMRGAVGLGERALNAALVELLQLSFTTRQGQDADARSRVPYVNAAMVKAWCKGDYAPETLQNAGYFGGEALHSAGYFGPETLQNAGFPRVRAAESSSSSSFPSSSPSTSAEAFATHAAMLDALKRWGISTASPGAKEYVWHWVSRYSVERVAAAAQASWRHGAKNVAYLESVLEGEEARSLYPGPVVRNFEDYRRVESREQQRAESAEL